VVTAAAAPEGDGKSVAFWLGPSERPLFAWLDTPADGAAAGVAVLCPTMGLESAYSSRALRDLAHRLAVSGWASLRFDYAATGDSAGSWTDPHLVPEWLSGVRRAIAYARDLGAPRVAVVGLRVGATLAAAELARGGAVDDFVLWDPQATGRAYLREQRAFWAFLRDQASEWGLLAEGEVWGSGVAVKDGTMEGPGVVFSPETVAALEPLAIGPSDQSLASRELVLARRGRKLNRLLEERLSLPHVESARIDGQDALLNVSAITPEETLEQIVSWLTAGGGAAVPLVLPARQPAAARLARGAATVVEQPVGLGPQRLFGMLCEPEGQIDPSTPIVVLLNAGRIGHHGPGRVWVELARSWAAVGVRSLRMDLNGIGDSPTRPGRTELVEFPADALEDLSDIRRALSAQGVDELEFVGLCSGGHHAVGAARQGPTGFMCLINPALILAQTRELPYRTFDPLDNADASEGESWSSTGPLVTWVLARLAPLRKAMRRLPGAWWVLKRFFMTTTPARILRQLTESDIDLLLVLGGVEKRALERGEKGKLRALRRAGGLRTESIPHLEHSLIERTGRERVAALLDEYVTSRLGVPPDSGPPAVGAVPLATVAKTVPVRPQT
jgi:dienelactone hydrolase